ncbi:uncharacterized protein LOC129807792 [Phlebotomus papatasi]|uniref:uncharacterized protein LOC129807792 n=1 Tax=Phlebotomus papatasi TaxID=29031 RepID=UPI002484204F|nr:uncharacterized protein LOC129807792 [Phlebotomus papatasi]
MASVEELLENFTKKGLMTECAKRNLDCEGTKEELAQRIVQFDEDANETQSESASGSRTDVDDVPATTIPNVLASNDYRMFSLRDVEDSLEKFGAEDSQDIEVWLEEFEDTAMTLGWNDIQKLMYCKKLLTGTARKFIFATTGIKNWKTLRDALRTEFAQKLSSLDVHRRMTNRKKKADEKFLDFVYEMQRLGRMGSLDEATICEYICDGIDDNVQSKAQLYGAKTVEELKSRIEVYEKLQLKLKDAEKKDDNPKNVASRSQNSRGEAQKTIICYNCGDAGHKSMECPNKERGPKCFKCNRFGHTSSDCKTKSKVSEFKSNNEAKVNMINIIQSTNDELDILKIKIGDKEFCGIIDSYSDLSLINEDTYESIKDKCEDHQLSFQRIRGFGGAIIQALAKTTMNIEVDGGKYRMECHVVPKEVMETTWLIGRNFLKTVHYTIVPGKVTIRRRDQCYKNENKMIHVDAMSRANMTMMTSAEDVTTKIRTTKRQNHEIEYEAWKFRKIKRIKRDREEHEAIEKERQKVNHMKNMTQVERKQELRMNPCQVTNKIVEILEEDFDEERYGLQDLARQNISKIHDENKRSYDLRSRRANDYRIGDLVAIRETEFDVGYKVRKKFVAPNEVIEILPHNRYKVKKMGTEEGPEQTI